MNKLNIIRQTTLIIIIVVLIIALGIIATLFIKPQNRNLNIDGPELYISCGCGCCGFDEPLEEIAKEECLYKSKGENIQDKINQDNQLSPGLCATVGCSFPIKYGYCD
ncbi:hypothetical protein KKB83_02675 [Patescibacteria group bacterium]|nr:hypothetical protein [Patescibacteria group bacterium]